MSDRSWIVFEQHCREAWQVRGLEDAAGWKEFSQRLDSEFRRLAELLWELYGGRPDYAFQVENLVAEAFEAYCQRNQNLKARDRERTPESGWFLSESQLGAVAYVDLFAGTLGGIVHRIPYLKELGVTYLHLMPFFLSPEAHNDGGYAVSSYRDTNPALGSMADLETLAAALDLNDIVLVADFVFNHTSDEHAWARAARAGNLDFQDFYFGFSDHSDALAYQSRLRDIFPEARKGSFTWCQEMGKWVWTTFNSYQWDLNYRNPAVFRAMAREMMALANCGIGALRLDAVAFIWKQLGTPCENLPQAHTIIKAFQSVARLACPSLVFKSEAIVHPEEIIKYIDLRECQLSYNPLLMAELWEASATKDARLLSLSLRKRHRLPPGCAWVNYVRCHDDIGWTFADEDAAELGIKGGDHRAFLNDFYLGSFPGSYSRGVSFQYNPDTNDRRICGTTASLAGVERALLEGVGEDLDTAVRRVLLLYGVAFSVGGIPLIYLGDEVGVLNRYEYETNPTQASDSRWVHRAAWSNELYQKRKDGSTVSGRIFSGLVLLSAQRRSHPVFSSQALTVMDTGQPGVLAFHKQGRGELLAVIANFADHPVAIESDMANKLLAERQGKDLLSERLVLPGEVIQLEPCELLWVLLSAD